MTPTAVLAQTDSVATRVSAVGTLAAVVVALGLARLDHRRYIAERRDREAAQARLVTLEVKYAESGDPSQEEYPHLSWVKITNHSEQPVFWPWIELMGHAVPKVRWALDVGLSGDEWQPIEVLAPKELYCVPFEHFGADGRPIDQNTNWNLIKKWVDIDDVKVTFVDAAGLRWQRTGNGQPVRVVQPATANLPSRTKRTAEEI